MKFDNQKFMNIEKASESESAERKSRSPDLYCKYSIPFLNDCLKGIAPDELVIIGADTGTGKTEMALDLAYQNATRERNVHLFSLEGSKNEALSRLKWKIYSREFFKNPDGRLWNYKDFTMNAVDTKEFDDLVNNEILNADGLNVFDNDLDLSSEQIFKELGTIAFSDLIVLDHLHYIELDESKNEYVQLSGIVRTLKRIVKYKKIPLVLVSHLRKKDRWRTIPDNEDFHGSSNIPKQADTCIVIYKDPNLDEIAKKENCSTTIIRVTKSRSGSERRYLGICYYNLQTRQYEEEYKLFEIRAKGPVELDRFNYPDWARQPKSEYEKAMDYSKSVPYKD